MLSNIFQVVKSRKNAAKKYNRKHFSSIMIFQYLKECNIYKIFIVVISSNFI